MASFAMHAGLLGAYRIGRNTQRSCGVAAEAMNDSLPRVRSLVNQSCCTGKIVGFNISLARCYSHCFNCRVVTEIVFQIPVPIDAANEGNGLLPRPKGPIDRNVYNILEVENSYQKFLRRERKLKLILRRARENSVGKKQRSQWVLGGGKESSSVFARGLFPKLHGMARSASLGADEISRLGAESKRAIECEQQGRNREEWLNFPEYGYNLMPFSARLLAQAVR